jgi:hypothetical protein
MTMRSFLSTVVLTASFALLVPDNAAEAVRPLSAGHGMLGAPAVAERTSDTAPERSPDVAWLLALGFLGAVMARRLRAD